MGCSPSSMNDPLVYGGLEFSITELSIAKRPGGADVGPANTRDSTEIEAEPAAQDKKPKKIPYGTLDFSISKVVADEDGAMFYYFAGSSWEDPTCHVTIAKRYSDFKTLHAVISEIMASEKNIPVTQQHLFQTHPALPEMPKANVWTCLRSQEKVIEERETQFVKILNAISRHPVAFQSKIFHEFLA